MQEAVGHTRVLSCRMDPARAGALCAALGLPHGVSAGDPLPPLFHLIYFWEPCLPDDLGPDGHTRPGDFVPPGLSRRMWAGGRLWFHAPLRAGAEAEKRSVIQAAVRKAGRAGPLALVTFRHEIRQGGRLCVTEHQDIVYRTGYDPAAQAPTPPPAPPAARTDEENRETAAFPTSLLFRYSALTLNGHRIHYDAPYARQVEGYDGLVVHGPLLAQLLALKAERELGPLGGFRFRATAPLMQGEEAALCRSGRDLWVRGPDGRLIMRACACSAG